jgi:hypothetical protein
MKRFLKWYLPFIGEVLFSHTVVNETYENSNRKPKSRRGRLLWLENSMLRTVVDGKRMGPDSESAYRSQY